MISDKPARSPPCVHVQIFLFVCFDDHNLNSMSHRKEDWNLYSTVVRSPDFVGMMYTSRHNYLQKIVTDCRSEMVFTVCL